ncbi:MAG: urease accessory protein UreD [Gordonia sp. (in: high G+C Gram-positive bacteria)]
MQSTVVDVERADGRARLTMSAGAGTVLIPRLLGRTADSVHVALVAGGAMLLGGDRLDVRISVGAGCRLELSEIGGTVAYGRGESGRAAQPCQWRVHVKLAAGATLLWMGRETVVADGADLTRSLTVDVEAGACALLRETTVLGRTGERGGRARLVSTIAYDGAPLLVEDTDFSGDDPVPGVVGDSRIVDTVLLVGRRPAEGAALGAMALEGPGSLVRYLGAELHASTLGDVWDAWRAGLDAAHPDTTDLQTRRPA